MSWLAVAIAATFAGGPAEPPAPQLPWANVGRVWTTPRLHVGVRGAVFVDDEANGAIEAGAAATVQVTIATPW
jgi:hypothetical protein